MTKNIVQFLYDSINLLIKSTIFLIWTELINKINSVYIKNIVSTNFKISAATSEMPCDLAEKWINNILVVLLPGFYINNVSYKIWYVFTAEERMGIETCEI